MLPWDKVDIEVLMVELEHVGKVGMTVRMMMMLEYWSNVDGHDDDEDGFLWMMVMFLVTKNANKMDRIIKVMDVGKGSSWFFTMQGVPWNKKGGASIPPRKRVSWVPSSEMGSGFFDTSFRYEYVGSWFEDDFFVRKDLNTVERYFQIVCIDLVLKSFLIVSKHH